MDRENFTPGADRAIATARRIAGGAGEDHVTLRHLALGLLAEEEGPGLALANRCGLKTADWITEQSLEFGREIDALHPSTERAIRDTRSLAREYLVDRTVNCDLLLLCVCRNDQALIAEWTTLGFSMSELERIVLGPLQELVPLAEQPDRHDDRTCRVLDANADRAREALRVLEDYCRFVLNDAILSAALKQLRHDLAAALPPQALLTSSGDTVNDVGTVIATTNEYRRTSLEGVATANAKRLQEALRSLEEYGKLINPDVGRACEQLRYRAYTLEQALLFGRQGRERLANARLYLLVSARPDLEHLIREAVAGGVDMIQLREKNLADRDLLALAKQVRRWTKDAIALFIVNDRPDIARLCEADGVHLGQDDLPVAYARRVVGPEAIIGVSTHDLDQLQQAVMDGASYVGIGPTFQSATKDFKQLAGLDFIRTASAATELPAFALGGIDSSNIKEVIEAGGQRIAISAAISGSDDPRLAARSLSETLNKNCLRFAGTRIK